jgi:GNAT superfamily N-acetyltransferase
MNLEFRSHYGDDPAAESEYIRFTREMFRLGLSMWRVHGFWDQNLMPFSFFLSGRIVSNVSIYLLPMVIAGGESLAPQFSAVGTEPEFRRQGLNRELTARALEWCRGRTCDFSFLFANREAFAFYEKCGFRRILQEALLRPDGHAEQRGGRRDC